MLTARSASVGAEARPTLSVFNLNEGHRDCTLVDWNFLGMTRSCVAKCLPQLSTIISESQLYIPPLSMRLLSTSKNIHEVVSQCLGPLPQEDEEEFYASAQHRIKQLRTLLDIFTNSANTEPSLGLCLDEHNDLPSDQMVTAMFRNVRLLIRYISEMKLNIDGKLSRVLDTYPDKTARHLDLVIKLVRTFLHSSRSDFTLLADGTGTESEITAYFLSQLPNYWRWPVAGRRNYELFYHQVVLQVSRSRTQHFLRL
jgi:hypothetical protein